MNFSRPLREGLSALRQLLVAILTWTLGYPLTHIFKRDPTLTLVVGRRGPVFSDNSKYFFTYAAQNAFQNERFVFLAGDRSIQSSIVAAGAQSVAHPSWRSLYLLLRCGNLVTDMMEWFDFGAYQLTRGARLVQIWHGAPLKHIELDVHNKRLADIPSWMRPGLILQKAILGRYPKYDVIVATSQQFIERAFSQCFKSRRFIACGYPRNDILFGWPEQKDLAYRLARINVDEEVLDAVTNARTLGQKTALYAPTFRQGIADPFEGHLDLERFSAFARQHNLLVIMKLHPVMGGRHQINQYHNLIEYSPLGDVYPLMSMCDTLITDYSSIYFDYLLLNRPIIFFSYDLENYLSRERAMYFAYEEMTPGEICKTQDEIETQLTSIIGNDCEDAYADRRREVLDFTHNYSDNLAANRLLDWIRSTQS